MCDLEVWWCLFGPHLRLTCIKHRLRDAEGEEKRHLLSIYSAAVFTVDPDHVTCSALVLEGVCVFKKLCFCLRWNPEGQESKRLPSRYVLSVAPSYSLLFPTLNNQFFSAASVSPPTTSQKTDCQDERKWGRGRGVKLAVKQRGACKQ